LSYKVALPKYDINSTRLVGLGVYLELLVVFSFLVLVLQSLLFMFLTFIKIICLGVAYLEIVCKFDIIFYNMGHYIGFIDKNLLIIWGVPFILKPTW
jgi:hypothetical protein